MAFIPVPNTAMVELRQTLFGQQIENVMYFEKATAPSVADLEALAAAVETWFVTDVMGVLLSTDIIWREAYVTDLSSATAPTAVSLAEAGSTGGIGSASLPGNATVAVSFRTAGRGRASRGRNYLSGLSESVVTGNQVSSAFASDVTTAYETMISAPPTGWTWVVVSRQLNGVARTTGETIPVTSAGLTDLHIDSQRRRLTGRGE